QIPIGRDFDSHTGLGASAVVGADGDTRRILVGNARFLARHGIDAPDDRTESGGTAVFVARDGTLLGSVVVRDRIRPESVEGIRLLKRAGLETVMLTGDAPDAARAIAEESGIGRHVASLLPADKVREIHSLRESGRTVAMVGDGINDAPALAAADLGIAVRSGTDIAVESSDVTLMSNDLRKIALGRRISEATLATIHQNLFFAFVYNVVGIPVAAGVLYPAFGILLSPVLASAAMALSSVSVLANSLRLKRRRITA
ncbi:MAG: HAD-IC family P-type ATPase, partial [Rhodothermales bacterium]|nr:HAD-IC family P-type ATPase [Rhodothermales bacterium]